VALDRNMETGKGTLMRRTIALAALLLATTAQARDEVSPARVHAHLAFLAGPELRGRGSATPDEATAAAYVAAQFESFGLTRAPGMTGWLQKAPVLRQAWAGEPELLVSGVRAPGVTLLLGAGGVWGGKVAVMGRFASGTKADVLVVPDTTTSQVDLVKARVALGATLTVVSADERTRRAAEAGGGRPRMPASFADGAPVGRTATVAAGPEAIAMLTREGATAVLSVPFTLEHAVTTNAVGYLPGTDPAAGVILLSAHLDHLGVAPDGTVWPGANDDASGTVALLEIARTMAMGKRPRRGVLFVAYGSEERGGFGARWFGEHPPVPLDRIVANVEFEMLGARVPKFTSERLMMTGYERSNFGPALRAHGALIDADPYPEENYFRRSDNYALALKGVVAHTVSGWGAPPTYHTPQDTPDRVESGFMVRAIGSLLGPVRWLANGRFEPKWNPGGRPVE
jgi:aminopeptidase YwaD